MKILFVLISLLFIPQSETEKIYWSPNEKLTWNNFQGKPIPSATFVASTSSGISFQYSYTFQNNEVIVDYSVKSFFNPATSWFVANRVNNHILKHEQTHFDISELHARMLRKSLANKKFSKNVKSEMDSLYHAFENKRRLMQTKFDAETDHSRNFEKEAFWQNYIAQQLAIYAAWK